MTQPVTDGRYDTVADFLDAANNELRNKNNREVRDLFLHTQYRGGWYGAGCGNGDDVQKLLRDGWTEGRQRVDAFMAKLGDVEAMPLDIRRRITRCGAFRDRPEQRSPVRNRHVGTASLFHLAGIRALDWADRVALGGA